jgi:hypothetical protein
MATPKAGYRNALGQKVPGVTTVLGRFKDSSGLIKWAYKQGREHENLAMRGLPAPGDLYEVTAKAALAGSVAHDLIEQHILTGQVQTSVPAQWNEAPANVLALAWNSYEQFRQWLGMTKIEVIETEGGGVSEQYQYGGTFDGLGKDALGNLVLIDWKTSNAVYEDYLVQLAAYAHLIEETSGRKVTGFHLLRVAKETADFAHHSWNDLSDAWRAFVLMRELYDIMPKLRKRT